MVYSIAVLLNNKKIFTFIQKENEWEINTHLDRKKEIVHFFVMLCSKAKLRNIKDDKQTFSQSECALIIKYFRLKGFEVKQLSTELSKDLNSILPLIIPDFSKEEIGTIIDLLSYPDQVRLMKKITSMTSNQN